MVEKKFCDICGKEIVQDSPIKYTAKIRFDRPVRVYGEGFEDSMDLCAEHAEAIYSFIPSLKEEVVKKA